MKRIFAERFKDLRQEKNYTITELSEKLGISIATISRWENDKQDITSDNLKIVAKFFCVSADYLIGLED